MNPSLFKAFITVGILVMLFGIAFILIDLFINAFTAGFKEIGIRFVLTGIITIGMSFVYKYHIILGFLLKQFKNKLTAEDRFSKWYRP
jgi:hypothetical protein